MSAFKFEVVPIHEVPREGSDASAELRPRVLVVDDEPIVADSLAIILSRMGFEATAAYSGDAALSQIQERPPAVLISDVYMPGMNGVELAMAVVQSFPACKVTLFSGHARTEELTAARAAGYDFPLLAKPIHPEQIVQHIRARLELEEDLESRPAQ
jgi:CheY-like chemotaxis protein